MNSSSPTESLPVFPGRSLAIALGGALLIGLTVVLFMASRDQAQRTRLEIVADATAVGDTHYLVLPEGPLLGASQARATFRGQPLFAVGDKRYTKDELELTRAGRDETSGLTIYLAPPKKKDAEETEPAGTFFLKIGPGEFIKVRSMRPVK